MYKSIFRILTIVEVISNLCFLAIFLSMPAWNNGKALDSESEDPGSIPTKGEIFFFKFSFFRFFGFVHSMGLVQQNQKVFRDWEAKMHLW